MSSGLQVFNDSNILQIDEGYLNYHMVNHGTTYCSTPLGTQNDKAWSSDLTFSGVNQPILAFYGPVPSYHILLARSGGSVTYRIYGCGDAPQNVNWMLFDLTPSASENFGLQVFNAAGQLQFDSSRKYMRVIDVITDVDYLTNVNVTRNYPHQVGFIQSRRLAQAQNIVTNPGTQATFITVIFGGATTASNGEVNTRLYALGAYDVGSNPPVVVGGCFQYNYLVLNIDSFF